MKPNMKRLIYIIFCLWAFASCTDIGSRDPYADGLSRLNIELSAENEIESYAGTEVKVVNVKNGAGLVAVADEGGIASIVLTGGVYRLSLSSKIGGLRYNASVDKVYVGSGETNVRMNLTEVITRDLVIKEIYCGGCTKRPVQEDKYNADVYLMVHNNGDSVTYLDGLCLGTLAPYNSNGSNPWGEAPEDYCPVIQAVWQIGGDGRAFPLAPGEDAVIVVYGAIDHSSQFPESVNLNNEDYFVCYNATYFWNTALHPAPGNKIKPERILDVVIKTGQANAYTFSYNSPAVIIFRAKDTTIQEFVSSAENVIQMPGSAVDRVVKVPVEWVEDAVEVFNGQSTGNRKRLVPSLDGGYVTLSNTQLGHSLVRRRDEEASVERGYEVLMDTNNSSNDFYESDRQLLHK